MIEVDQYVKLNILLIFNKIIEKFVGNENYDRIMCIDFYTLRLAC
jgi:hypothetical protein